MNTQDWNAVLARHIPWHEAYATVEREARAALVIADETMSTTQLADLLYPPVEMRGEESIGARKRLFKALAALAGHGLRDCCTRGPEKKSPRRGILVRPWLWHPPRIQFQPKEFNVDEMYRKGDRFLLSGHLCEIIAV